MRRECRRPGLWLGLLVVLTLLSAATRASCQASDAAGPASPRELFERGVAATQAGDLESALSNFERAYALKPNRTVLYNIARTYVALGRSSGAAQALRGYLKDDGPPNDPHRAEFEELLRQVERRLGRLSIDVSPPDATIEIDGAPATPDASGSIELATGPHVVAAEHPDFEPTFVRVTVTAGMINGVHVRLSPKGTALLSLGCKVPEVTANVANRSVTLPKEGALFVVDPGRHDVRFERPGYQARTLELVAEPAGVVRADCALVPEPVLAARERGELRVMVSQPDATVLVDGARLSSPVLPAGTHRIEVVAPGFSAWQREVVVPAGKSVVETAILAPTPERQRAERERSRKTWAWTLAGVGAALAVTSTTLFIVNHGRYDDWQKDHDQLSQELANGIVGPDQAAREADLKQRATGIQRTDDIAVGCAILGGASLAVSGGLFAGWIP